MNHQVKFEQVRGYATYAKAQARGEEIAARRPDIAYRWVVIALPTGRFAPMVIVNTGIHGGPGPFLGELNCCLAN